MDTSELTVSLPAETIQWLKRNKPMHSPPEFIRALVEAYVASEEGPIPPHHKVGRQEFVARSLQAIASDIPIELLIKARKERVAEAVADAFKAVN